MRAKVDDDCPPYVPVRRPSSKLSLNWRCANTRLGGWPKRPRPIKRSWRCDLTLPKRTYKLGITLWRQGNCDQAMMRFERAIALRPDYPEAYFSLGTGFWYQDKFDQAVAMLKQAIVLKSDYVAAHHNLAAILRDQLKLTEARQVFERLHALEPDSPLAQFGLAACYLAEADYERGWPAFEARLRMSGAAPQPDLPRWTGQPLAGRTLLLLANEGLGDTIQFVRYARAFKARGARVVVAVAASLGRILASYADLDELFILGSAERNHQPAIFIFPY